MSAVFFADESSVFTASDDGIARMWDSSTGECKHGTSPQLRWGARGQGLDPSPAPSNPLGFLTPGGGFCAAKWLEVSPPPLRGSSPPLTGPPCPISQGRRTADSAAHRASERPVLYLSGGTVLLHALWAGVGQDRPRKRTLADRTPRGAAGSGVRGPQPRGRGGP